ncbi:MAG: diguanylate cyclase, partial [Actinomycetota bacterium]
MQSGSTAPAGSQRDHDEVTRLRAAFDNVVDSIIVTDADLRIIEANAAARAFVGDGSEGTSSLDFVHPDDLALVQARFVELLGRPAERLTVELRVAAGDEWWPVEIAAVNHLDTPGVHGIILSFRDLRAEVALRRSESLFRTLATAAPVGIVTGERPWDVSFCNQVFADLVGRPRDTVTSEGWAHLLEPADRRALELLLDGLRVDEPGEAIEVTFSTCRTALVTLTRLAGGGYVAAAADVTEVRAKLDAAREAEAIWAHAATHDALTGLANRSLGADRIDHGLLRLRRRRHLLVTAFVDLDRFKDVNDAYGHDAGDELLRSVARRLRSLTRAEDTVVRWGGDEFVVVATAGDERGVELLGQRLRTSLARPVRLVGATTTNSSPPQRTTVSSARVRD